MKEQDKKLIEEFLSRADVRELIAKEDLAGVFKLYIGIFTKYLISFLSALDTFCPYGLQYIKCLP
jgi:hypothetical protein